MAKKSKTLHIIVDTREKNPFRFPDDIGITRKKLDAGDYSIRGWERYISIERKGWPDYYSCCMGNKRKYEAFRDQLTRLVKLPFKTIIVEGILSRTFTGFTGGDKSDLDRLCYITANLISEFGIPIIFTETRSIAQSLALYWLQSSFKRVKLWNPSSSRTPKSSNTSGAKGKQSLRKLTKYNPKRDQSTS